MSDENAFRPMSPKPPRLLNFQDGHYTLECSCWTPEEREGGGDEAPDHIFLGPGELYERDHGSAQCPLCGRVYQYEVVTSVAITSEDTPRTYWYLDESDIER